MDKYNLVVPVDDVIDNIVEAVVYKYVEQQIVCKGEDYFKGPVVVYYEDMQEELKKRLKNVLRGLTLLS